MPELPLYVVTVRGPEGEIVVETLPTDRLLFQYPGEPWGDYRKRVEEVLREDYVAVDEIELGDGDMMVVYKRRW